MYSISYCRRTIYSMYYMHMYICMCIYIYIYICIHTYTHAYTDKHVVAHRSTGPVLAVVANRVEAPIRPFFILIIVRPRIFESKL